MDFGDDCGHGSLALPSGAPGRSTTIISDHDSDRAFFVTDEGEKRLRSCKPSYSLLSRMSGSAFVSVCLLAVATLIFWMQLITTGRTSEVSFPSLSIVYLFLPFVPLMILLVKYANKYWEWLFPKTWFCLGRQEAEYAKRSNARKILSVGIGLVLTVSVVAGVITSAITQ